MESQSLAGGSEPTVDVQWSSSYNLGNYSADDTCDGQFRFTLHYAGAVTEDPTVEDLIGSLSIDSALPDSRATWHRNYTPLAPWIRAHVIKQAMGWNGEKQLADHFEEHPELAVAYGFVGSEPMAQRKTVRPNPPAQARLWEMWHEEFGDKLQTLSRTIAAGLVELARKAGIPAPDDVFQPDGKQAASKRSETRLIADTTKKVWQYAKPFVTEEFFLKRGDNAQIHGNAFWEQHAFMGVRKNMFAESDADSFYVDSTRYRTPSGSTHRWQIRKLSIEEMRQQHRRTTKRLIERALAPAIVIPDTAVDRSLMAEYNLVLFGRPTSNAVYRRLEDGLPIDVSNNHASIGDHNYAGDLGVEFIYPNPEHPDNLVQVETGTSLTGVRLTRIRNWIPTQKATPDYAIFNESIRFQSWNACRAAGFFDKHWEVTPELGYLRSTSSIGVGDR